MLESGVAFLGVGWLRIRIALYGQGLRQSADGGVGIRLGGALALSVDFSIIEVHLMIYYVITIAYLRVLK
jgi:hypothetical protein